MAYVEPTQVVTGVPITAAKWNQDVVDNSLALYNTPGVIDDISIFSLTALIGENTLIPLRSAEIYNSGVTVDTADYKMIAQYAGVYAVFAYVITGSTTSANNGSLYAQSNDGQVVAIRTYQHAAIGGGFAAYLSIMGFKKLAVGDYVQFYFRQNLVASLSVSTQFVGMHWIGSGE